MNITQETYGEDPFLSGQLARAYVQGLQGEDKRYVQANAGCKHFAAYAGPEDTPPGRFRFDAQVTISSFLQDIPLGNADHFSNSAGLGSMSLYHHLKESKS